MPLKSSLRGGDGNVERRYQMAQVQMPNQRDRVDPVINATLKREVINAGFKALFSRKSVQGFCEYVFREKIKPALWNVARETLHFVVDAMFNDKVSGRRYGGGFYGTYPTQYTSYNSQYVSSSGYYGGTSIPRPSTSPTNIGSIVCGSEEEADALLDALAEHYERGGKLTVATLFEYAGLQQYLESWMHSKGWMNLANFHKEHVRGANGEPQIVIFYPPPYGI